MRVVIVGSGIVGASAAHHLAAAGAEVVLVDADHPGRATRAGAGIVCPWATTADDGPFVDLYAAGAAHYDELIPTLAEAGPFDVGYRRVGALVLADDRPELEAAETRVRRRAAGRPEVGPVERLDHEEARDRFPLLRPGLEVLHIAGGARVDGQRLAAALVAAATGRGATIESGRAELLVDGSRVRGVRTAAGEHRGDAVVVAGGAWTNRVLEPVGRTVDVEPQKGQIVHLRLPGVETGSWPVLLPIGPSYVLTFDDSRVVVGATRETGSGFDTRVTAGGVAEVIGYGLAVAPGLADAEIIETRVGLRPFATGSPTIGAIPGLDGLLVGTGLGAGGLTMGPLTGRLLADLALGRPTGLDLTPFAPSSP